MNQTKETRVVRFVVDRTVEAALHTLTSSKRSQMDMAGSGGKHGKTNEASLKLSDVACMLFDAQLGEALE
jgi:SNF2 family DNA or RNA helicase